MINSGSYRLLVLVAIYRVAVDHRVAVAWRKFWALKVLLLNSRVSRKRRLQLFDSSISSSFLYGAHAWTPRTEQLKKICSVQNRMLRRICGVTRHDTEEWVPWIQRATHKARQLALDAGVRDWVRAHAIRKWSWAGHAARRSVDSWLWRVTFWRDSEWNEAALEMGSHRPLRPSRRRWMKWEEPLRRFMAVGPGGSWSTAALDRETWEARTEEFASWFESNVD